MLFKDIKRLNTVKNESPEILFNHTDDTKKANLIYNFCSNSITRSTKLQEIKNKMCIWKKSDIQVDTFNFRKKWHLCMHLKTFISKASFYNGEKYLFTRNEILIKIFLSLTPFIHKGKTKQSVKLYVRCYISTQSFNKLS